MIPTTDRIDAQRTVELQNLLAVYFATAPGLWCPGCDGLLTADIVSEYPVLAATGGVPGETELCARHPELSAHIVTFFYLMAVTPHPRSDPAAANDPTADALSGSYAARGND